jgi:hypothetical protein
MLRPVRNAGSAKESHRFQRERFPRIVTYQATATRFGWRNLAAASQRQNASFRLSYSFRTLTFQLSSLSCSMQMGTVQEALDHFGVCCGVQRRFGGPE